MKDVQGRKRAMVDSLRQLHLDRYQARGAELILGESRFVPSSSPWRRARGSASAAPGQRRA